MDAYQIFDESIPFEEKAINIFEFQKEHNSIYGRFCKALGIQDPSKVDEIPLLPIQAFKEKEIVTAQEKELSSSYQVFQSSGTSGMSRSRHIVLDTALYKESIFRGFDYFYDSGEFVIWAYTPEYNLNPASSLIWMLNALIERENSGLSKFLELNRPLSQEKINEVAKSKRRLMLFGAAFGLLDLLEISKVELPANTIIMETGGMKTYRREISKSELHQILSNGFGIPVTNIHSEYGMTELLSQAYSQGSEWFKSVPWMKVSIRDPQNPMREVEIGEEGLIGVMDLANLYSCSFILTGDKGIMNGEGKFNVLGRWNPENLRGCNFLIDKD